MDPLKKLIKFLDKALSSDSKEGRENTASIIVSEINGDFDNVYSDLVKESAIVGEIESLASDLEWSNGSPADLDKMWDRLKYLHTKLKSEQNTTGLDAVKIYVLHKIKRMAVRDSRLSYASSLLQSLWPDTSGGVPISDQEADSLIKNYDDTTSERPFNHGEIEALHKIAKSVLSFAVEYGSDDTLEKVAHYLHILMSQDGRTAHMGWDIEEYMSWYFDQSLKKAERGKKAKELMDDWESVISTALKRPSMLRDYAHNENWRLLDKAIEAFIDLPDRLSLVGFTVLSPDSFLWKIFDGENIYYLYAEDYVPSLEHVTAQIKNFWPDEINLEFLPVKNPKAFEDSTPNKTAVIYQPPENEYEFSKYAWPSGYDFVFLLKSSEKIEDYENN